MALKSNSPVTELVIYHQQLAKLQLNIFKIDRQKHQNSSVRQVQKWNREISMDSWSVLSEVKHCNQNVDIYTDDGVNIETS